MSGAERRQQEEGRGGRSARRFLDAASPAGWDVQPAVARLPAELDDGNMEYKLKLVGKAAARLQGLTTQMRFRLGEGGGVALYRVGVSDDGRPVGIAEAELRETVATLLRMADELQCRLRVERVCRGAEEGRFWAQLAVRKTVADFEHVRCCVIGDVDSGKSTLVGTLTSGQLDDGRGSARLGVLRHRHEIRNGRTSSVSHHLLGFDRHGGVTNYASAFRFGGWDDMVQGSAKVLTLTDLAGDERYLKTTLTGMTAHKPDYALLAASAERGVTRMTRRHLGVTVALGVPAFCVITKVDRATPEQLAATHRQLSDVLRASDVQRLPVLMRDEASVDRWSGATLAVPVFECSAVTGRGLDLLKRFLHRVPKVRGWSRFAGMPAHFAVDGASEVDGVGVVASGIVLRGAVRPGQQLLLGPDARGNFRRVTVRGVHIHHSPCAEAAAGHCATLLLRRVARSELRRGMVAVDTRRRPRAYREFSVALLVLHDGLRTGSQPVLHVGTVRQAAQAVSFDRVARGTLRRGGTPPQSPPAAAAAVDQDRDSDDGGLAPLPARRQRSWSEAGPPRAASATPPSPGREPNPGRDGLGTSDRGVVRFRFCHRPEHLVVGAKVIVRDGAAMAIGRVKALHF